MPSESPGRLRFVVLNSPYAGNVVVCLDFAIFFLCGGVMADGFITLPADGTLCLSEPFVAGVSGSDSKLVTGGGNSSSDDKWPIVAMLLGAETISTVDS